MKANKSQIACVFGGAIVAVAGMCLAFWAGKGIHSGNQMDLPRILNADSSSSGKSISLASARVSPEFEGLFLLDHKAGNLFCILLSPRTGREVATYSTNIFAGLNLANLADLDLVMTTAFVDLTAGGRDGNARPATCVCFVADGNSGRAAGYSFQFNAQAVQQSVSQAGQLQLIWQGAIRAQGFGIQPADPNAVPNPDGTEDPAAGGKKK